MLEALLLLAEGRRELVGVVRDVLDDAPLGGGVLALLAPEADPALPQRVREAGHLSVRPEDAPLRVVDLRAQADGEVVVLLDDQVSLRRLRRGRRLGGRLLRGVSKRDRCGRGRRGRPARRQDPRRARLLRQRLDPGEELAELARGLRGAGGPGPPVQGPLDVGAVGLPDRGRRGPDQRPRVALRAHIAIHAAGRCWPRH
mmetsp:Transcript_52360/g.147446  ORF Transcript_52360/g.147446 Transcript_52360/m.147446 type:complete len:200 (-) Transcript_52360:42-641(-)